MDPRTYQNVEELSDCQTAVTEQFKRFDYASVAERGGKSSRALGFRRSARSAQDAGRGVLPALSRGRRGDTPRPRLRRAAVLHGQRNSGAVRPRRLSGAFVPTVDTFGRGFVFCRGIYTSGRQEAGGSGWSTDYPDAERNSSIRLSELTKTRVKFNADGEPDFVTVRLTDEALFAVSLSPHGRRRHHLLHDADVDGAAAVPEKGGFIWVDDYWGPDAWENWVTQISAGAAAARISRFGQLPLDHPHVQHAVRGAETAADPSIQYWRTSGGSTSERGIDSETPNASAIVDAHGNIMVLMTHNTDISDAWEREGEDPRFFYSFSPTGYAVRHQRGPVRDVSLGGWVAGLLGWLSSRVTCYSRLISSQALPPELSSAVNLSDSLSPQQPANPATSPQTSHPAAQSPSYSATQPTQFYPATQQPSYPATQLPSYPATQLPSYSATQPGHD